MFCCKSHRRLWNRRVISFIMGYLLSKVLWFWTPADYDIPDATTGLTPREKDIVQKTWKLVRVDARNNSVKLFLKFFETFPEYQKLFKAFSDVPKDNLASNGRLLGHATSVLYAFNSLVDNLEDPECLVELLYKIGTSHKPRGITSKHFQNLAKVVISFLEEALGKSVIDERAKEAWTKTLEVANSVISKALEDQNN